MLRNECRDTDTKVDVESIVNLTSRTTCDPVSPIFGRGLVRSCGIHRRGLLLLALCELQNLNVLGRRSLDDAVDVDAGNVDSVRRQGTNRTGKTFNVSARSKRP